MMNTKRMTFFAAAALAAATLIPAQASAMGGFGGGRMGGFSHGGGMGGMSHFGGAGGMGHFGGVGRMGGLGHVGNVGHVGGFGRTAALGPARGAGHTFKAAHGSQTFGSHARQTGTGAKTERSADRGTDHGKATDRGKDATFQKQAQLDRGRSDATPERHEISDHAKFKESTLRPTDVLILDDDRRIVDYVRKGHDVVLDGPGNTSVHVWCGEEGQLFIVCRDYNKGIVTTLVVDKTGVLRPVPKAPEPKKESYAKWYDADNDKTFTRTWPANGGPPVDSWQDGNHLRD
jgi:hypothetical protein